VSVGDGLLVAEEPAVVVLDSDPLVVDDPERPRTEDVVDPIPPATGLAEPHPASARASMHPTKSVADGPASRFTGRRRAEFGVDVTVSFSLSSRTLSWLRPTVS
jgi:hypothetical protein